MDNTDLLIAIQDYLWDASFDARLPEDKETLQNLAQRMGDRSFDFEGAEQYGAFATLVIARDYFNKLAETFAVVGRPSLSTALRRIEQQVIRTRDVDTERLERIGRSLAAKMINPITTLEGVA